MIVVRRNLIVPGQPWSLASAYSNLPGDKLTIGRTT